MLKLEDQARAGRLALFITITLLALQAGATTTPTFTTPPSLTTENGPEQVVAADFNHDGILDIAVTTRTSVDVFLGKGDNEYQPYQSYPIKPGANAIVVGDINNDGNPDLIMTTVVLPQPYIRVLLGNGDGTFRAGPALHVASLATSLAIGDFNHDGSLDIAIGHSKGSVGVALGNGNGTFRPEVLYSVDRSTVNIAVADFDQDGNLDIATSGQYVTVLYGNGDGTFASAKRYSLTSSVLAVADVNSDGKPDIVCVQQMSQTISLKVLTNKGNRTFTQKSFSTGEASLPGGLSVGDFNGDGNIDVVLSGHTILFGKGNGDFVSPSVFYTDPGGYFFVVDINGDHRSDFIQVVGGYEEIQFYFSTPQGILLAPKTFSTIGGGSLITVADFNNDSHLDIAALTVGQIQQTGNTLLGNGDGTFQPGASTFYGAESISTIAHGDFNNDGNMDVVLTNDISPEYIFFGNGDGTFHGPAIVGLGKGSVGMVVEDFNADGNLDLAVAERCYNNTCTQGAVQVLLGNGDGTFPNSAEYPFAFPAANITAGDFNGDGVPDLAVCGQADGKGYIALLAGKGDGSFQQPEVRSYTSTSLCNILAGDFNNDGIEDLALTHDYELDILFGVGDGSFLPAVKTLNVEQGALVADDFNGDGYLDVVVAGPEYLSDGIEVLTGKGDGRFLPPQFFMENAGIESIQTARLGGDLYPDIIVGTTNLTRSVAVLVNATK